MSWGEAEPMQIEQQCEQAQSELSSAHDQGGWPSTATRSHAETCEICGAFSVSLEEMDLMLAKGKFDRAPDLTRAVLAALPQEKPQHRWWVSVAAAVAVGVVIGALVGGIGSRSDIVQAQDLNDRFHAASPAVIGLSADLLIVERGWHPDVFERVYVGSLRYNSPEQLEIILSDTTSYPGDGWVPNDMALSIVDGDATSTASARCPQEAVPGCLQPVATTAITDRRPFDDGVIIPLEIVGPARGLSWSSGMEVVGSPLLDGRRTIQVETTVAGVDLIGAITNQGAWRELHPTDRVLLWLDGETLVPVRVEVFASESPERQLWQLRRGYLDEAGEDPIFIIQLNELAIGPTPISVALPESAMSAGFVDGPVTVPLPDLDSRFMAHRSGTWPLPDGGTVNVATWSDGRSWIMVQTTDDWKEDRLFGMPTPFVRRIDLGGDSVGYAGPNSQAIAIHGPEMDVLVSGSVAIDVLLNVARSLELEGVEVPAQWPEASIVDIDQLPAGTLVPEVEGWAIVGDVDDDEVTILLSGGGSRSVRVTQRPGARLDPPVGPDISELDFRGVKGRFDAASTTLDWVEDGRLIQIRSDSVGLVELLEIAESMTAR